MSRTYAVGDTVEVQVPCAYVGEVGVVSRIVHANTNAVEVKFPDGGRGLFFAYELRPSQQKLELE